MDRWVNMKNCLKCQIEMDDSTNYLYNSYCKACWLERSPEDNKSLQGFCKECGSGWNYAKRDGSIACLNCYRKIHGTGAFPQET